MNNVLDSLRLTPRSTSRTKENAVNSSFSFTSNKPKVHRRSISNSLGLSQIRTNLKKLKDTSKISLLPEISPRHKEVLSIAFKKTLKITVDMPKVEIQSFTSKDKMSPLSFTSHNISDQLTNLVDRGIQTRDSPSPRSIIKGIHFPSKISLKTQTKNRQMTPWLARMRAKVLLNRFGTLPNSAIWSNNSDYQPILVSKSPANQNSPQTQQSWVIKLVNDLKSFIEYIEVTYRPAYDEIDLAQKGYITFDDLVNFVILKNFISPNSSEIEDVNYGGIREKAKEILGLLGIVTNRTKIHMKDFFALASVFENFNENKWKFDLTNHQLINEMTEHLHDLKSIFKCYSHNNLIAQKDLSKIFDIFKQKNDFKALEALIGTDPVDFSRFLRCIPCFNLLHIKTLSHFIN